MLFLDLDDFKQVNDSLGHARGDKLLAAIAMRLQAIVRPSDLVARWGGDEFAILQRPVEDPLQTAELAEQIIREIRRPVFVDGYEVIVGASIGSASAPDDGKTPEAILSNADMALYAAKGEGRGNWRAFEKSMDAKIQIRRLIELDLRAAVANDAIEVYYQPIVSRRDRRNRRFRGAGALEPSGARAGVARRVHSDRRGTRPDGGVRRQRAAAGVPGLRLLARQRQRLGQPVADTIPQRKGRADGPRRALRGQARAGAPRPGDHRIPRCSTIAARRGPRSNPCASSASASRSTISAPDIRA